ncbi:S41 family peptidase [Candidatus Uabimicrobium sp. HlEnr_7]|uniref:S41 family peptidase n=1 Tax=Candidatus Uabimicrobium helgolandensis TaxID=3095367 RepID=UPI003558CCBA
MKGYYRFPTLTENSVFFVCEDDIWKAPLKGGVANRFTKTPGITYDMAVSHDGKWLAYSAGDYGSAEVYCISVDGGTAKRLTFHPSLCTVVGWDGNDVLFASNIEGSHSKDTAIYRISKDGGHWQKLPFGLGNRITTAENGKTVAIQRGYSDPATWKSYGGGRTGKIWLKTSEQPFKQLTKDQQHHSVPMIHKKRVYFLCDTKKQGNIFSCDFSGNNLTQHTFHENFYVRRPNRFGNNIAYQLGGEIHVLNLSDNQTKKIEIEIQSCGSSLREKFVSPSKYLSGYDLSPCGNKTLLTTRGQLFCMKNWQGAAIRIGEKSINHRFAHWSHDGERIVAAVDSSGEEEIIVYDKDYKEIKRIANIGRGGFIERILLAPKGDNIAVAIQSELYVIDLLTEKTTLVDKGQARYFRDFSWSPDATWLTYSKYEEEIYASIFLYSLDNESVTRVTTPDANDYCPRFSSHGKYLYFLSKRVLNPYADSMQFEYSFPESAKPYMVILNSNSFSPFSSMFEDEKTEEGEVTTHIDLEGIGDRIVEIPVKEGLYLQLTSHENKVFLLKKPLEGRLGAPKFWQDRDKPVRKLVMYDLANKNEETVVEKITAYSHSYSNKKMVLRVGKSLCVVNAGSSYKKMYEKPSEKSGWIDLKRIKISITPHSEWHQIFLHSWRLQRDFFWKELDNWENVQKKYLPLVSHVRTRSELTDVISEMHGDLETSHAYTFLGDQPPLVYQRIGMLGVRTELVNDQFVIKDFYRGDLAHQGKGCPLLEPGMNVKEGDIILAVNGQKINKENHLQKSLINLAKEEVELTITNKEKQQKNITVKALISDVSLRYKDWVNQNRNYVTEQTNGKVGYLHVPDMSTEGLISFHRDFLWQYTLSALIVDVRFNGGGNVSPLLIEKLQRKVIAHLKPRRGKKIFYPRETLQGPVVVLCNEYTGSDGDIFCQVFKSLKIGTLIGTRTWGGVIGIINDKELIDKGIVTQPEFAFYFNDGSEIEGIGVEPDIYIENTPQSYSEEKDLQLDCAIETLAKQLEAK